MAKKGRPAKDDPIKTVVSAKLSQEDIRKLNQCCEKLNASKGEVIRKGINLVYAETKE